MVKGQIYNTILTSKDMRSAQDDIIYVTFRLHNCETNQICNKKLITPSILMETLVIVHGGNNGEGIGKRLTPFFFLKHRDSHLINPPCDKIIGPEKDIS